MNNQLSDICICGHSLNFHADHSDIGLGVYCVGDMDCECLDFKLDNLRWLEHKAEEHG